MDLEIIILSDVSQKEKDKYHISLTCGIQNTTQMNLSTKQKKTHREKRCCQGGGVGEGSIGSLGLADANYYIQYG